MLPSAGVHVLPRWVALKLDVKRYAESRREGRTNTAFSFGGLLNPGPKPS